MAHRAVSDGIQTVVATPHTLNEVYENPFEKVKEHIARLQKIFLEDHIPLTLCPGAEAHICPRMADRVRAGEIATVNGGGRYILVEFPVQALPSGYRQALFQLKLDGITPIITHPERNMVFQQRLDILYDLAEMGCLFQITAMSVTGEFGEEALDSSHKLLALRLAHVIASDAHSSQNRPPILSRAVEAAGQILGSQEEAETMVRQRPRAILDGDLVQRPEPVRPDTRKKRRFWLR